MTPNNLPKIAVGNAGWPFPPSLCYGGTSQFRFCGGRHPPRVPEIWTSLGSL